MTKSAGFRGQRRPLRRTFSARGGRAAALLLAMAIGFVTATPAGAQPVVFAAASLQTALDRIAADFATSTGIAVTISYAATSALARQIESGAPADIFISADLDWMDYLEERNLIDPATRTDLLGNSLVLVAPAGSTVALRIGTDRIVAALGTDARLAMADVAAVPAGRYGRAALEALGEWTALETRIVQADNVRAALNFVALGEAALGIVYATDALAEPRVRTVATFPTGTHPPIVYPGAITASSTSPAAAQFFAYLQTQGAAEVFIAGGFIVLFTPTPN